MQKKIKLLSPATINRIAAGEVIERPASVVKELVENAIDSGADKIIIEINQGGRNLVKIIDNGCGINKDELELCVERHATSKLIEDENNLLHIHHLGFRGEALPSIGAVARLSITSRTKEEDIGYKIKVWGGEKHPIEPAACEIGTILEVRDLFFATPARLKFLKSERSETNYIVEIIEKIAMCYPKISFILKTETKTLLNLPMVSDKDLYLQRLCQLFGEDFASNVLPVSYNENNFTLNGYIGLPTFNRGTAQFQYIFVNGRPIKDKAINAILRAAFMDYIAHDRFPVAILFFNLNVEDVDVNVHPTKAEVRFRDINSLKSIVNKSIKKTLFENINHKVSTEGRDEAIAAFKVEAIQLDPQKSFKLHESSKTNFHTDNKSYVKPKFTQEQTQALYNLQSPKINNNFIDNKNSDQERDSWKNLQSASPFQTEIKVIEKAEIKQENILTEEPLGDARAQIHTTYIVAETKDGLVLVDQHAAHERITYEKMKELLLHNEIKKQRLLIPEIIECNDNILEKINNFLPELEKLGINIQKFGNHAIIAKEIPIILGNCDVKQLLNDIIDSILEYDDVSVLEQRILHIYATKACHGSIRSGRKLNINEMNALLRSIENQDFSGQCNHGRPTYIKLKLNDIEKLFGRK